MKKIEIQPEQPSNEALRLEAPIIRKINQQASYKQQLAYLNSMQTNLTKFIQLHTTSNYSNKTPLEFRYDLVITWKGILNIRGGYYRGAIDYYPNYDTLDKNPYNNLLKYRAEIAKELLIKQFYNLIIMKDESIFLYIDHLVNTLPFNIKDKNLFADRYPSIFNLNIIKDVLIPVVHKLYKNRKLYGVDFFVKNLDIREYEYLHKKIQKIAYFNDDWNILDYYYLDSIGDDNLYLSYLVAQQNIAELQEVIHDANSFPTTIVQFSIVHNALTVFNFMLQKEYDSSICFLAASAFAIAYNQPRYLKYLLEYKQPLHIDDAFNVLTQKTGAIHSQCGVILPDYSDPVTNYMSWEQISLLLEFNITEELLLNYVIRAETQLYSPKNYNSSTCEISILPQLMKRYKMPHTLIKSMLSQEYDCANLWNITQFFLANHTTVHYLNSPLYKHNLTTFSLCYKGLINKQHLLEAIDNLLSEHQDYTFEDAFIFATELALMNKGRVTPFGTVAAAFCAEFVYPFHNLPEHIIYRILSYTFMACQYTAPEINNWQKSLNKDMTHIQLLIGTDDIRKVVSYPQMPINIDVTQALTKLWQLQDINYNATRKLQDAHAL